MAIRKALTIVLIFVGIVAAGIYGYIQLNTYEADTEADRAMILNSRSYYIEEGDLGKDVLVFGSNTSKQNIIFYPGGLVEAHSYAPLAYELSEKGYQVFICEMPFNLAILDVNAKDKIIEVVGTSEDFYLMGHSLGGVSGMMTIIEKPESVNGLILLASYGTANQNLSEIDIPVLSIIGRKDGLVDMITYDAAKRLLPDDTVYEVIEGGNHAYYGNYGEQAGDFIADITSEEQQSITVEFIDEFLSKLE